MYVDAKARVASASESKVRIAFVALYEIVIILCVLRFEFKLNLRPKIQL
jgi:hypothetical protein